MSILSATEKGTETHIGKKSEYPSHLMYVVFGKIWCGQVLVNSGF